MLILARKDVNNYTQHKLLGKEQQQLFVPADNGHHNVWLRIIGVSHLMRCMRAYILKKIESIEQRRVSEHLQKQLVSVIWVQQLVQITHTSL